MSTRIAQFVLFMLICFHAVAQTSEGSEQAAKDLATKLLAVTLADADWVFAKTATGQTDYNTKKSDYFYINRKTHHLLVISIIEQGRMPANESEVDAYIKRFEGLGYTVKGCRFIPAKRKTFLIEEQSKEQKDGFASSTTLFIQGEGEVYAIMGTIADGKSELDQRVRIISQVSLEGSSLSRTIRDIP